MAENYTPLIQRLITALDNPLTNNSYVWSLTPDIDENFKGSILQYIIDTNELESLSANDLQTIAGSLGITQPSNGNWLYSIVKVLEQ
jgi:hypothetical protein